MIFRFELSSKILRLDVISGLTLTYIPFHCTCKLLDKFYCNGLKDFSFDKQNKFLLLNKILIELLKVYLCKHWLIDKIDVSLTFLKYNI